MATQTLFIIQGTDFSTDLKLLADDGTAINVAGFVFKSAIRQNPYSNYPSANLLITATDAPNGNISLSLGAANTANLGYGSYIYTVTSKDTTNITSVLMEGDLIVSPSALVTQPLPANVTPQIIDDVFFALQGQNSFYLSYVPANTSNVMITYNSTPVANSITTYTINGKVLMFANNATQGDIIEAKEVIPIT